MLADILHKLSDEEKHIYYPRPSISGPERCIRQLVYWGLGIKKEPLPGRTYHIFDDGIFHEELVADWIRKSAFQIHSQQMQVDCGTEQGIHLQGSIDGIITDMIGQDYLWENKSINHFTCQRFWAGEVPLDYVTQCCLYLRGLKKVNPDINKAVLLIKNKNTSAYLEFIIEYSRDIDTAQIMERINSQGEHAVMDYTIENITTDAFAKFAKVQDYVERKTLPRRQYEPDNWRCEYCSYNHTCYANYQAEFAELKTDMMLPNEIADMVRYRQELAAHRLDMEKEEKQIATDIKAMMIDANAREGRAGEYIVRRILTERKSLDKKLIPQEIKDTATKITYYERLAIKKVKGDEK
jgi:hypothetical protein